MSRAKPVEYRIHRVETSEGTEFRGAFRCPSCETEAHRTVHPEHGPFVTAICADCGAVHDFDRLDARSRRSMLAAGAVADVHESRMMDPVSAAEARSAGDLLAPLIDDEGASIPVRTLAALSVRNPRAAGLEADVVRGWLARAPASWRPSLFALLGRLATTKRDR